MGVKYTPKIQYKNTTVTGDTTSGSAVVSNLSTVSGLSAGMYWVGAGVPAGVKIQSVGASSVTLDQNATATASGVSFEAYFQIDFPGPPAKDDGEEEDVKGKTQTAEAGNQQDITSYIEGVRKVTYEFLTDDHVSTLRTFFRTHAALGNTFRYFEQEDVASYVEYKLRKREFPLKRQVPKGNSFLYELKWEFRRVIL